MGCRFEGAWFSWSGSCWRVGGQFAGGCCCPARLPKSAVDEEGISVPEAAKVVPEPAAEKAIKLSFVVKQDFVTNWDVEDLLVRLSYIGRLGACWWELAVCGDIEFYVNK